MATPTAPALEGDALRAVEHRGSHMQIIACAGSGKTEVVAQRVADLIADGVDPAGIIAFTFTERAAEELKARISARAEQRLGTAALDRLGAASIGTIHAYCVRLLQQQLPRYETFGALPVATMATGAMASIVRLAERVLKALQRSLRHRPLMTTIEELRDRWQIAPSGDHNRDGEEQSTTHQEGTVLNAIGHVIGKVDFMRQKKLRSLVAG